MRRERLVPSVLSPVELDINLKIRQSPVDWLTSRHGGTSLASVCAGILCGLCACGEPSGERAAVRVAYLDGRVAVFESWRRRVGGQFVTSNRQIPRAPAHVSQIVYNRSSRCFILLFSAGVKRLTAIRSAAAATPAVLILRPIAKSLIGRVRVPLRDPLPNQPS